MNIKKIKTAVLLLFICLGLLLTACMDANKGDKIEEMLEDTYGGRFTLKESVPCRPGVYFIISPIPTYYQYLYEWNRYKGETISVTTKGSGYQTNATYVMYHAEMNEYFTAKLNKKFPGGVISSFIYSESDVETKIKKIDFDDAVEKWQLKYDCVLAVDDVNDHKVIEKAIADVFGDYKVRVELHVVSTDDVDEVLRKVDFDEEDGLQLFFNHKNALPTHEYYLYISDTTRMKGPTGWYELKGK